MNDSKIRKFVRTFIAEVDQAIQLEVQRIKEEKALKKYQFGEDISDV